MTSELPGSSGITPPTGGLDPLFLRAVRGDRVETTPIWIMRQAGRYLPEYRRVREKVDFLTLCRTPDLATEVTLQPIRRFGFDAAILFSDILTPLEPMGIEVEFNPGPVITHPVASAEDIQALKRPDPTRDLGFVLETVRMVRRELPPTVALIGFAGAPFTMAAYMVEGRGSKDFSRLKSLMYREPVLFHSLMEKLTNVVSDYLRAQIEAGAQAVQLFDTWAGLLSPRDYAENVFPHVRRVVERVSTEGVPFILYGNGTGGLLELMDETGADVLGLDWRVTIGDARRRLGHHRPLQGNLDPAILLAPVPVIQRRAREILEEVGPDTPHVFNLGHGITPDVPVEAVAELVRFVHEEGRRLRAGRETEVDHATTGDTT
jgi:uroporphyrinogen decarboxylase